MKQGRKKLRNVRKKGWKKADALFFFFFWLFTFRKRLKLFLVYQNENFDQESCWGKKSGKVTSPPPKNFPVTPLMIVVTNLSSFREVFPQCISFSFIVSAYLSLR